VPRYYFTGHGRDFDRHGRDASSLSSTLSPRYPACVSDVTLIVAISAELGGIAN